MNEEGKFLKKLWFCVGVWGGGGRGGGKGWYYMIGFFINWFYKVNMQKKWRYATGGNIVTWKTEITRE